MRLNEQDADFLARSVVDGRATAADVNTAVAINGELFTSRGTVTLIDAHILATYTTRATRLWEFQAQEGHMQTARAMLDEGGSIFDFDEEGEAVRFSNWRELVRVENNPMWGGV